MTRTQAAKKATRIRSNRAKEKVSSTLNVMRLYGNCSMTVEEVSTEAQVDRKTARKYMTELGLVKKGTRYCFPE